MKTTLTNILHEIITADNTSAVEATLAANAETLRRAIIENETTHEGSTVLVKFAQRDNEVEFTCTIIDGHDVVEIFVGRHSNADAESTTEEFADDEHD